jgi:hypothetical protein
MSWSRLLLRPFRVSVEAEARGCQRRPQKEGCAPVKKGRHRRFEEARKLKQSGPGAFDLGLGGNSGSNGGSSTPKASSEEEDEYAALAEKYGVVFDDDDEDIDET